MENITFVREGVKFEGEDARFEVHITLADRLQPGATRTTTVDGCTFSCQEMLDGKGNSFYFIDARSNGTWKGEEGPVIGLINHHFGLELMECVVQGKGIVGQYTMTVDRKSIELPAALEYRSLALVPGIYATIEFPPTGFLDPLQLDHKGTIIPSKFGSIKEIPDEGPEFVF